jgi:2-hydroxychromene-2-carboxylate isomerase
MTSTRPPRLYFSFRSPYSWMGLEKLRRHLPGLFSAVELIPYWDPDEVTARLVAEQDAQFHYQQMSKAKHLYVLADTKRMAARLGLTMAWPVDVDPWWEVPHLAWLAARRAGAAERCYDALVAARWQRGENICDPEVLRHAVGAAGLDGMALAAAPQADTIRAEGVQCLVRAYEEDIFGVPYVCYRRQRYWGLDRMDIFLEDLGASGPPADPADDLAGLPAGISAGAYDRDTAGGCG